MKNFSLVSAVSVLALTLGSQALFAAEREVPAAEQPAAAPERAPPARERAAPARERAAPSARRTAPRERAPTRAAQTTTAQSTSWTGNQAGGFGGGNAGAGSFADPVLHPCAAAVPVFSAGGLLGFDGSCPSAVPFSFSNTKGGFTGGGFIGRNVQIGNWVVGVEGDIAGKSNSESSYTQPTTTTVAYFEPSTHSTAYATRTDLISGSVRQGTDGSIRPRIGWLINPWTMAYITGGIAFEHVSASYTYLSTITYTNLFSSFSSSPVTAVDTLAGSGSFDKTLTGGTVGGGVEFVIAYGLKARLEYRWTGFGGLSFDVPLARSCTGSGCSVVSQPPGSSSAHIDVGNIAFHTFRAGVGFDF
jgi:outer membrane immunogenic protein